MLEVTSNPFLGSSPLVFWALLDRHDPLTQPQSQQGSIKSLTRLLSYPAVILFLSSKLIQFTYSPSSTQTSEKDHSPLQSS